MKTQNKLFFYAIWAFLYWILCPLMWNLARRTPHGVCLHEMSQYTVFNKALTSHSHKSPLWQIRESNGFSTRLPINTATRSAGLCLSLPRRRNGRADVYSCHGPAVNMSLTGRGPVQLQSNKKIEPLCNGKAKQLRAMRLWRPQCVLLWERNKQI